VLLTKGRPAKIKKHQLRIHVYTKQAYLNYLDCKKALYAQVIFLYAQRIKAVLRKEKLLTRNDAENEYREPLILSRFALTVNNWHVNREGAISNISLSGFPWSDKEK